MVTRNLLFWITSTVLEGVVQATENTSHQQSYSAVNSVSCNNDKRDMLMGVKVA